ncbi:MAG: hypothetical protein ISP91_02970 [Pseudomonadales bacterium]|nr:hypothetical protein [Pseudomonadales bacterium]
MNVSAPGKLFLLGEYAVLEGGPALLVPVKQRAHVTLGEDRGDVTSITDRSETLSWAEAAQKWPLLNSLLEIMERDSLHGQSLTLDTSEFFQHGQKLGLGSSAALTVALVKACHPAVSSEKIWRLADACHRHFQGGIGSGADIALAAIDQPVRFSMDAGPETVRLPDDLHMLAIWTGKSASTTALVGSMQDYRARHPTGYKARMTTLIDVAEHCLDAVSDQDTCQILARIEQYDRQLYDLSSESGVHFYNQLHENMRKKVKLTYKPSGAGGGDFGIAYSTDPDEITALANKLKQEQTFSFVL